MLDLLPRCLRLGSFTSLPMVVQGAVHTGVRLELIHSPFPGVPDIGVFYIVAVDGGYFTSMP